MRYYVLKDKMENNRYFVQIRNKYVIMYQSPKSMSLHVAQKFIYDVENSIIPIQVTPVKDSTECASDRADLNERVTLDIQLPDTVNDETERIEVNDDSIIATEDSALVVPDTAKSNDTIMDELNKLNDILPQLIKSFKEKNGQEDEPSPEKSRTLLRKRRSSSTKVIPNNLPKV